MAQSFEFRDRTAPSVATSVAISPGEKASAPYRLVPFDVPAGTTRIEVRYRYLQSENCVIDLGVGDPRLSDFPSETGLRGWSGGARDWFFIGVDAATPGYEPGPIEPGAWNVILGLYRVPPEGVTVAIEVRFSSDERTLRTVPPPANVRRSGAGWYKGDLQSHTFHSDAKGAPQYLHASARREGLDFLAVTDHNTVTQQAGYFDAASSPELVFVPAYEFTTEFGHANVFGARRVFDFRVRNDEDVVGMIARIRESGALFSINHDKPTIPWQYPVPEIDCMEVWQAPWLAGNHISLARYQDRLAGGRRITAIGGSDFHQPAVEPAGNLLTLARPCTFLWLEELSVPAILDALRNGRSFVSESPTGPRAVMSHGEAGHGEAVDWGGAIVVRASGAAGDELRLWDATGCIATRAIDDDDWSAEIELDAPGGFVRAEIVATGSRQRIIEEMLAFLGGRAHGHVEYEGSDEHPVLRALASPIYLR